MYTRAGVPTLAGVFPLHKDVSRLIKKRENVRGNLSKMYNVQSLPKLVRLIFYDFIKLILFRVAEGDTVMLPGSSRAYITLKKYPKREIMNMLNAGKLTNLNLPKMKYNMPMFILDFGPESRRKDIRIHVPFYLHEISFKSVEDGKVPWTEFRKTFNNDNRYRGDP
jgi:hypothetical protein